MPNTLSYSTRSQEFKGCESTESAPHSSGWRNRASRYEALAAATCEAIVKPHTFEA